MNTTKTILVCAAVAAAAAGAATDIDEIGAVPSAETSRSSVTQADLESSPLARLAKAIEDGDATFVAKLVHYPLERTAPLPSIPNEEEFVKRFPVLFDETFRERMRNGSFTNDWAEVGWRGTMFDNGSLWVGGTLKDGGLIYGVNYQSAAEKALWEAAIEAERKTLHESIADVCNPVAYFVTEDGKTAGRIDALDENRNFVRIALFDTPVRSGAKPSLVFRAWNGPGIWLGDDWRNAVSQTDIGTDMTPTFVLHEKENWDDAKFSISRPAETASWNDILLNANVRSSRFDSFGALCESPPTNAVLLDQSGALALYSGETADDAAFNESIERETPSPQRKRRSLFFRWRAQDGTEEWRLMLTTGLKSIGSFCGWEMTPELLNDMRKRFEIDDAAFTSNQLSWDVACRTREGSRVACRLLLYDGLLLEPADGTAKNYLRKNEDFEAKPQKSMDDSEANAFLCLFSIAESLDPTKEYVVKEGDDIYSIAMKHEVQPLVLRRLNPGKDLAELSPGDRIRVPADAAAAAEDAGAHAEAGNAVLDAAWLTRTIPKMKADANTPLTIRPLKSIGAGAGWERCYVLSSRTLEMDETESDRRLYFRILDNGSVVPLASSGGFQYDPRDGNAGTRDVFRDVDGDGTTELVCPQMWGADGQTSVEIYRLNGIGSEFCGGDSLIAALCPDFSPTNQTWGGAMGCGIERDAERFPVWFDDPGPLTLSCTYEVPRPPSEVAPGEHAYRSVHRRIPLENVRLPFVPYSPAESGWVAPAARTAATPPKKKPAPPKTEPAPDPTVRTGGGTMVSSAYRSPRNSARALRKETSYIILHTTEGGAEGALPKLSENGECHFAVDTNGTVYTIVDKSRVAFHAGLSMWDGRTDLDGCSIGIAIVGRHDEDIADAQYAALKKLLAELKTTYRVSDARVLAHSMVAYGEPNEWHPERHRGRVRSAMNLATPEVRARLGLLSGPAFDPDVEAGRLSVGDPELAEILYGKKPEKPE